MLNKIKNRHAQTGEAMTWIVATLIIIFILVMAIYISSLIGRAKSVQLSENYNLENDLTNTKTEMAYKINFANREKIDAWILEVNKNEE